MKNNRIKVICEMLILFLIAGCSAPSTPEETTIPPIMTTSTEATEATIPETTLHSITEPYLPTVEEMIPNYDELIQAGFVHVHGLPYLDKQNEVHWNGTPYFQYTGENKTIVFPGFSLALTLPDGWRDHISVVMQPDDAESLLSEILLYNNAVFETQMEYVLSGPEQTATQETVYGPYCDYFLKIRVINHEYFVINQESVGGSIPSLIPTAPTRESMWVRTRIMSIGRSFPGMNFMIMRDITPRGS